jgi:hypothetical protein
MAAGLGFKTFNSGDVLSAADVNGYLMQGVLVFASTAARDSAITAPAEGQFAFTKDTNSLFYYDGAAWVASGATGDIEGVTAGTGISGGGTSGTVTITNSMATAIDAKGDLVVGTGADTFSKLTAGANDTILTADSSTATGLKWAAASSGGGMTLINTGGTTLTGASVTISSIPSTYNELVVYILNCKPTNDGNGLAVRFNGDSTANRHGAITTFSGNAAFDATQAFIAADFTNSGTSTSLIRVVVPQYANTSTRKWIQGSGFVNYTSNTANMAMFMWQGIYNQTDAISSLEFRSQSNFLSGTVYVYGVK